MLHGRLIVSQVFREGGAPYLYPTQDSQVTSSPNWVGTSRRRRRPTDRPTDLRRRSGETTAERFTLAAAISPANDVSDRGLPRLARGCPTCGQENRSGNTRVGT